MSYTERDLLLAKQNVEALETFIADQERRFSEVDWEPRQRRELEDLLQQFKETLDAQRALYREIWDELHPGPPE